MGQGPPSDFGPPVEFGLLPGFECCVSRAYAKRAGSGATLWSGRVMLTTLGRPVLEMEVSLIRSDRNPNGSFVAMPQRQYTGTDGQPPYQRLVSFMDERFTAGVAEAIRRYMAGERGLGPTQRWPEPAPDLPF
jgi:hypothetical protein